MIFIFICNLTDWTALRPLYLEHLTLHGLNYALPQEAVDFQFAPFDFVQVNAAMNQLMVAWAMRVVRCGNSG
ncbi:MAG: hypothetical protein R3E08_09890 [Thiotrichaceae bacterium]